MFTPEEEEEYQHNKEIMDNEITEFMNDIIEEEDKIYLKNLKILDHIEELKSKEYRDEVAECLEIYETNGEYSLVDKSTIKPEHYQKEEDWNLFDHVYVDQYVNGGYVGDEFAGNIYIPITKNLYLKAHYNM